MKKKALSAVLFFVLLLTSYTPFGEEKDQRSGLLLQLIVEGLSKYHYHPRDVNDEFSAEVFTQFINKLDYNKRFLLKKDVTELSKYRLLIDDEINKPSFDFYHRSVDLITQRMGEASAYYETILAKPFSFDKNETVELDVDKVDFVNTPAELRERWRQSLKYQVLTRLARSLERQEQAKADGDTSVQILSYKELEAKAREEVRKSQADLFSRLNKIEEADWQAAYLNSIMETYDPHTGYFPPEDKANFDIAISGQLEGIGASLSEKDGYIRVQRVVPGSAAWKQGELKEGDIILKVAQADEEPVDVVDMRVDHAVKMIRGKKGTEVRLTVKKLDGTTSIIPIIRDIVVLEETYASSAVLESNGRKAGYIKLPKFYADFNRRGGRSSAEDVKKELIKLREQQVDGVILDLRNNGGGSLQDVVDMAGLFIKDGPIVQVKGRESAPYVMTDRDTSVVYGGPLVIMVNGFSASASEILAAAMQDYRRALIVGSSSTFGKGTVQRFFELDNVVPSMYNSYKPLGSIKLTTQKFYRINGDATQLKGVTPDIILPDNYTYLEIGEREQDFAMAWDEIPQANYHTADAYGNHFDAIVGRSRSRTTADATFEKIDANARRVKRVSDITEYPLNLQKYQKFQEELEEEAKEFEALSQKNDLKVEALDEILRTMPTDSLTTERNNRWSQALQKDIYLGESFRILNDINL
ncbi:carboxyl-terminal processing protease [Catalinimonas alkaloidigena]|uniref:Carboxyl-terminal processing protease n=1 Tax=Catalinimonas alkaloidigena TaxID=1075417 RepID=A0A1G9K5I7_9BACT|nr:carboxy terminal-processing peptidase [Catalinimonas alkaloidigena]SDL45170.1 carboxyl-terminal processing protease [Catalinimonas alkaloidigena]